MIVDDNETNRRILSLQTQSWGMIPCATASGAEALEWVRRGDDFAVALLDMKMPEMDGVTLAQEIRKVESAQAVDEANATPMILLSSLSNREAFAEQDREFDFAAHLAKPIKPSQLFDALAEVFSVELESDDRQKSQTVSGLDPEMAKQLPLRILLAEDNNTNQILGLRLLGRLGYRADVAGNGFEALDALRRQPYDVVLMDVQMPDMDGLEATRTIIGEWPQERRPQIIAMTANAMQGDREMCLAAGMDDYISKPIQPEILIAALRQCRPLTDAKWDPSTYNQTLASVEAVVTGSQASTEDAVKGGGAVLEAAVRSSLEKLTDGDRDFMLQIIDAFLADAPALLEKMQDGVSNGTAADLRLAAHSLKSNSADFGAVELRDLCRSGEMMGKDGNLTGAEALVSDAAAAYRHLARVLTALRGEVAGKSG